MDIVSKKRRSEIMSKIRGKDTVPELRVRRYLHGLGLRYRLHRTDLPGRPDIVFPGRRLCVFVHGCFWHGCSQCIDGTRKVKSRIRYWKRKIRINQERDERNRVQLAGEGWNSLVIWECETTSESHLLNLAKTIITQQPHSREISP